MQIQTAAPGDVESLVELWVEFMDFHSALDPDFIRSKGATTRWADYITSKLNDKKFLILVAKENQIFAGYIVAIVQEYPPIRTIEKFGYIQEIAVAARFRRRGVARLLFQAAEEWLLSAGVPQIEVKIDIANNPSQSLFKSEGFVRRTETLIKKYDPDSNHDSATE